MNDTFLARHSRHILLKSIGLKGVKKLTKSKVVLVGLGALGSNVFSQLVSCEIGEIGLIDFDKVEISNLPRQPLYSTTDIGKLKTDVCFNKAKQINSNVKVCKYSCKLNKNNINELINHYDIVVDGLDNVLTKLMLHDFCIQTKKVFIHAGILEFQGQLMTIISGETACLRCLFQNQFEEEKHLCNSLGVFSPIAHLLASLQVSEIIKCIVNKDLLAYTNKMLRVNLLKNYFNPLFISRNLSCFCNQL